MSSRSVSYSPVSSMLIPFAPQALRDIIPTASSQSSTRDRIPLDRDWHFCSADSSMREGELPALFNNASQALDLPHSWPTAGIRLRAGKSTAPPATGWYMRELHVPVEDANRRVALEMESVSGSCAVWINGHPVGRRASAWLGCRYNLTQHIQFGGRNTLLVRVDAPQSDAAWHRTAGIISPVWLMMTNPLHVAQYGVYVAGKLCDNGTAHLSIGTMLYNDASSHRSGSIVSTIFDPEGEAVGEVRSGFALFAGERSPWQHAVTLREPRFLNSEGRSIYSVATKIEVNGSIVDECHTSFDWFTLADGSAQDFFVLKGTV